MNHPLLHTRKCALITGLSLILFAWPAAADEETKKSDPKKTLEQKHADVQKKHYAYERSSAASKFNPPLGKGQSEFYNYYTRPNDDFAQNVAAGLSGDKGKDVIPYEVSRIHCGLITEQDKDGKLKMRFNWNAEMTTGRHVEAYKGFVFREAAFCSIKDTPAKFDEKYVDQTHEAPGEKKDEKKKVTVSVDSATTSHDKACPEELPGKRTPERVTPFKIGYSDGATEASNATQKIGSTMGGRLEISSIPADPTSHLPKDGTYAGTIQIRTKKGLGLKEDGGGEGLDQISGMNGPGGGVYQKARYNITIKDGKIVSKDIACTRFEDPPMMVVSSNYRKIAPFKADDCKKAKDWKELRKLHCPYPPQPPAAECAQEEVGMGELGSTDKSDKTAGKKIQKLISSKGCLNCHGQGSANHLFCDDGRAIYQGKNGSIPYLYSWVKNCKLSDRKPPYPGGMQSAFKRMLAAFEKDKDKGELLEDLGKWARANGVDTGKADEKWCGDKGEKK